MFTNNVESFIFNTKIFMSNNQHNEMNIVTIFIKITLDFIYKMLYNN